MGRPQIQDSFAERFGTLHSVTVSELPSGQFQALARLCYLTEQGEWKWVNRRCAGKSAETAREAVIARVTKQLGCVSQEETNRRTNGLHRGHRRVAPGEL